MNKCKMKYNVLCCIVSFILLISGSAAVGNFTQDDIAAATYADTKVYVGGIPFGVRFDAGEVTVVHTNPFLSEGITVSPAEEAGITANDVIKTINGTPITSITDVINVVNACDGSPLSMTLRRGQKDVSIQLTPKKCDDNHAFRLGVMLKDSSAGIGTVTFINQDSLLFAGLGHGICDSASGEILQIESGYISNVKINGVNKGKVGAPGELRGNLESEKCGKLLANTEVGIYGIFTEAPKLLEELVPIANMAEVETGKATILCTLDDNQRQEYEIEIAEINHNTASKTKNYVVRVTDKRLLSKTGGIVQGMSGSPIIQDGKLIGAVTHVFVNDPTRGYGIFIENMLAEAEKIK